MLREEANKAGERLQQKFPWSAVGVSRDKDGKPYLILYSVRNHPGLKDVGNTWEGLQVLIQPSGRFEPAAD